MAPQVPPTPTFDGFATTNVLRSSTSAKASSHSDLTASLPYSDGLHQLIAFHGDRRTGNRKMVAPMGLEPINPFRVRDFKSRVYANSTTEPFLNCYTNIPSTAPKVNNYFVNEMSRLFSFSQNFHLPGCKLPHATIGAQHLIYNIAVKKHHSVLLNLHNHPNEKQVFMGVL